MMWRQLPGGQASAGAVRHCFGFFGITSSASSARGERNGGGGQRRWRSVTWSVEARRRSRPRWAAVSVV